jgi:type I restriction enzyme S subunit
MKFRWETEFKETEIGEIPKDWEVKKLGEILISIIKGKNPKKQFGILPYLSAKFLRGESDAEEFYNETAGIFVDENEIIILWDGFNSGEIFKSKKGILASTMCKLLFKEETINKFYVYFLLKAKEDYIKDAKSGTDDRHVDKEYFLNLLIPFPPLPEQSRIATVLSWFDDLIEVKKKQNEILEKTAMAIFKSWFIDFEPFRDGEFVYNEELGKEIPKGWEVNPIEKEFYLIKGKKYEVFDDYFEGCSPYLLIETFKTGKIEFWTIEKEPQVDENDVVLVADGESSGKVLRYQKGILGSTLLTLKPKSENSIELKHLIYLTLKFYEDEIMSHRTGSAIPHLDKDFLKSFLILLPPSHILQSFHSLVEPLFQKIILNQKQIMTIRKIRDTLLPLLVFGKLRVEEL